MMFTSRFTILAVLTLLAGANAGCATCQETLYDRGVAAYELVSTYVKSENGFTECSYVDKEGDEVNCEYMNGQGWMGMDAKQDVMWNELDERSNIGLQKVGYISRFCLRQEFSSYYVFCLDQLVTINCFGHLEIMSAPPGLSVSVSNSNLGEYVHSLFERTNGDIIETKSDTHMHISEFTHEVQGRLKHMRRA
ncbi:uncharacterized protein HD556DRAFT_1507650 [Suillus plorans]|uniref:Uncharacterized protein n=1 Tax=Suillus plorans TaxID=116603 RepID=A0A9P7ABN1_9AGAM|nr:uncharacterized protein HD556DRAFT_1507650 [Suillus plorans]KAG1786137.1 hypothetical protein HD556DRAFT_1507650 [Suillus plorans]